MCADIDCQIEEGLCHCGCGERAPLAKNKKTAETYGHVKGKPVRYSNWHHQRPNRLSPWVWQRGRVVGGGYGEMRDGGVMRRAHRYGHETYSGPVPEGLMMEHLCRNDACGKPCHLEPVTAKENAARRDRAKRKRALRVLR